MAGHLQNYPAGDAEPFVRGDTATFVFRFQVGGVDQDITTWTWRCHVRAKLEAPTTAAEPVSACTDFEVTTPDALPGFFDVPGTTPCVLLVHWTPEQTALWADGYVADVEQLTPVKKTWVIVDKLRVDRDVSYAADAP